MFLFAVMNWTNKLPIPKFVYQELQRKLSYIQVRFFHIIWKTIFFPIANIVYQGSLDEYLPSKVQYTPSVSTIILSGPTYSSQNVQQIWESTLSKSDYLVGHFCLGRTFWSDVRVDIKRFLFTFLEVNMSNILWSMCICKRTFFPVCRMCGYVNTLV